MTGKHRRVGGLSPYWPAAYLVLAPSERPWLGSRTVLPAFLTRNLERESVVQTLSTLKGLVERLAEARRAIR